MTVTFPAEDPTLLTARDQAGKETMSFVWSLWVEGWLSAVTDCGIWPGVPLWTLGSDVLVSLGFVPQQITAAPSPAAVATPGALSASAEPAVVE
jgi:hypothetical protein